MPVKLWDHTFKTIGDRNALSAGAAEQKIGECKRLWKAVASTTGDDSAKSLFSSEIILALSKCLEAQAPASNVDDALYSIYYGYAANAAIAIDQVVSDDFPDLHF